MGGVHFAELCVSCVAVLYMKYGMAWSVIVSVAWRVVLRRVASRRGVAWRGTALHTPHCIVVVQCSAVYCGVVWCSVVRCSVV